MLIACVSHRAAHASAQNNSAIVHALQTWSMWSWRVLGCTTRDLGPSILTAHTTTQYTSILPLLRAFCLVRVSIVERLLDSRNSTSTRKIEMRRCSSRLSAVSCACSIDRRPAQAIQHSSFSVPRELDLTRICYPRVLITRCGFNRQPGLSLI